MKAYTRKHYGGPEVLTLSELPMPEIKANEVLVRVKASSINPADWRILRADPFFVRFSFGILKPKNPRLGVDMSGVIEAVGDQVSEWQIGDEVVSDIMPSGFGAYGEYVAVPTDLLVRKPDNVSFEQAAGVPIAGITALQAFRDMVNIKSGDEVLINGASGGVGTYALQIAKQMGAKVTAVCSGKNAELVKSIGADEVIDYTKENYRSRNNSFDIVLDNIGNCTLKEAQSILKANGTSLHAGYKSMKEMIKINLKGKSAGKATGKKSLIVHAKMNTKDLATLMEMMSKGQIKTVVDRTYQLDGIPEGISYQELGHARGKVIVHIS